MLCILYAIAWNEMIFIEDDQTDVFLVLFHFQTDLEIWAYVKYCSLSSAMHHCGFSYFFLNFVIISFSLY